MELLSQLLQRLQAVDQSVEERIVLCFILGQDFGGLCYCVQHLAESAQLLRLQVGPLRPHALDR